MQLEKVYHTYIDLSLHHRMFNKKSEWAPDCAYSANKEAQPVYQTLLMQITDQVGMKMTALAPDYPRLISKHFAPMLPSSTE